MSIYFSLIMSILLLTTIYTEHTFTTRVWTRHHHLGQTLLHKQRCTNPDGRPHVRKNLSLTRRAPGWRDLTLHLHSDGWDSSHQNKSHQKYQRNHICTTWITEQNFCRWHNNLHSKKWTQPKTCHKIHHTISHYIRSFL